MDYWFCIHEQILFLTSIGGGHIYDLPHLFFSYPYLKHSEYLQKTKFFENATQLTNKDNFSLKGSMSQKLEKLYSEKNFPKRHEKSAHLYTLKLWKNTGRRSSRYNHWKKKKLDIIAKSKQHIPFRKCKRRENWPWNSLKNRR